MSPADLRRLILQLDPGGPIHLKLEADLLGSRASTAWYRSQREHWLGWLGEHSAQDEFIYVVSGTPTLVLDDAEHLLAPGMCCGYAAGRGSHHLVNRSEEAVFYLEVGDRDPNDEVFYPDDDIQVRPGPDGKRRYEHKNGQPY
jgi:uncharacterized cupin superfamily protein